MSDSLAIAAVTASLAEHLRRALDCCVPDTRITHLSPAHPSLGADEPAVNVRLLAAAPMPALRNLPRPDGGRATVAMALTYLISFHGDESALVPQRLMGAAAAALDAEPVLGRDLIAATVRQTPWLAGCTLADAAGPIRITQLSLGLEMLVQLSSGFGRPHPAALIYEASPVSLG